jgi:hypothetical protein
VVIGRWWSRPCHIEPAIDTKGGDVYRKQALLPG